MSKNVEKDAKGKMLKFSLPDDLKCNAQSRFVLVEEISREKLKIRAFGFSESIVK